ncbi:MAG: hypothetical protein ACFFFB_03295 [Candidatus Heimdallarchaeota archaeon]
MGKRLNLYITFGLFLAGFFLKDSRHIISLMREITKFLSRYRNIVNEHYLDYYNQIIVSVEQKISTS